PVTVREAVDFVGLLFIYPNATPVFIVEVKPPADFRLSSKRREADLRLRRCFLDITPDMEIPVLYGASAFGTKIAFYQYDKESGRLDPASIAPDTHLLIDTAPKEWWCYDIVEQAGADKFREIVGEVKKMCEGVGCIVNQA
ncbi:hypothetical protein BJ322DRAFT_1006903, partial [Thelephora terrestris]